jgi:cytochrome c peroxidase
MNKPLIGVIALSSLALVGVVALRRDGSSAPAHATPQTSQQHLESPDGSLSSNPTAAQVAAPIQPLPEGSPLDARKVALGKRLFNDTLLSKDGSISCASCHDLSHGGADSRKVSIGVDGAQGEINAPTVFNSSLNFKQFWDGRADTLEQQIDGPVNHPKEMASTWADVVAKLGANASYSEAIRAIYTDGVSPENVRDAIATFERSLKTPNSRFDRFLEGDTTALDATERQGYELFGEIGCITCHQGANLGGNTFQTFGLAHNYFEDRGGITKADLGRFNVTGKERDKFKFKVPTLRNIAETAPYFHDGSAATLNDAVQIMARYQLGHDLEQGEADQICAFLRTLTGDYRE